jgi:3-deoxy-manno-octulosonate cytidylyltransferase (CMP-KDO synthetase)
LAAVVVIPARWGSSRFPGKIVAAETGRPLVQHVVDQVRQCTRVVDVIVATDDKRIVRALEPFQTTCVMTSPDHPSGTDRIAEAIIARPGGDKDVVVNVQGDEPEIEPATIDALVEQMETYGDTMATAATSFPPDADPADPNLVKVVMDAYGKALYFSRAAIPFCRDGASDFQPTYYLHQGIYAYTRKFLLEFALWQPTALERAEKLEQLRVLERGWPIHVLVTQRAVHGIDTPEQYAEFVQRHRTAMSGTAAP